MLSTTFWIITTFCVEFFSCWYDSNVSNVIKYYTKLLFYHKHGGCPLEILHSSSSFHIARVCGEDRRCLHQDYLSSTSPPLFSFQSRGRKIPRHGGSSRTRDLQGWDSFFRLETIVEGYSVWCVCVIFYLEHRLLCIFLHLRIGLWTIASATCQVPRQ